MARLDKQRSIDGYELLVRLLTTANLIASATGGAVAVARILLLQRCMVQALYPAGMDGDFKTDITRDSFSISNRLKRGKARSFSRVLKQQGRVDLDAD